jgi:hypothetical protein
MNYRNAMGISIFLHRPNLFGRALISEEEEKPL